MHEQRLFPKEVTGSVPRITLTGSGELHVEQHRGLVACGVEEISLRTSCGLLSVQGEQLRFRYYSAAEAKIDGLIRQVTLTPEGRRG